MAVRPSNAPLGPGTKWARSIESDLDATMLGLEQNSANTSSSIKSIQQSMGLAQNSLSQLLSNATAASSVNSFSGSALSGLITTGANTITFPRPSWARWYIASATATVSAATSNQSSDPIQAGWYFSASIQGSVSPYQPGFYTSSSNIVVSKTVPYATYGNVSSDVVVKTVILNPSGVAAPGNNASADFALSAFVLWFPSASPYIPVVSPNPAS